ncbi:kinase-like domain-containing protein [Bombardia bombarda]|uniref:Autophagy-related protein 1 n=1 Tax=Bombardia bombarda TaxID=252184 RepID=A0AA39WI54_9PEZI|nr:kinase-like domain-containing protein [Bombardia bombarda]
MHVAIPLDGAILCHSFTIPPRRSDGWHHGAMSEMPGESGGEPRRSGEKPRDIMYPLKTKTRISSGYISSGAHRDVFSVKNISDLCPQQNGSEHNPMQQQQPDELQPDPHEVELVAKELRRKGDDPESRQRHREMLEEEWNFGVNQPHPHVNPIVDIAYDLTGRSREWLIEKRQPYCLDQKDLPFPIDAKDLAAQLLSGLQHYNENGKMHRDIKPGNVLLRIVKYCDKCQWFALYTDHSDVASTHRLMKVLTGTPFYCAPEILDGKRYNEKADIFSLGVLLLRLFTKYEPSRDRLLGKWWPRSSSEVQEWMKLVDRLIEEKCDPKYRPLLRGMLLRDPGARWSVDQFIRRLDQSQMRDQTSPAGLGLPWTNWPLTETQIKQGLKRKYCVLERDNVVESGDGESDNAKTVILNDDIVDLRDLDDIDMLTTRRRVRPPGEWQTNRKFTTSTSPGTGAYTTSQRK